MIIPQLSTLDEATRQMRRLAQEVNSRSRWCFIPQEFYQADPLEDPSVAGYLRMIVGPDRSWLPDGTPIKYSNGDETRYGIVTSAESNRVHVNGPPLVGPIRAMWVGKPELVVQLDMYVSGNWEASVSNGIHQAIAKRSIQWLRPTARLCLFRPWKANSTTPPYANVTIGGKRTSTRNNGRGVQVNSGGTRSTIDPLTYRIEFGQIIDVDITQAGTNSGSDLTVNLNFVLE